MNQLMLFSGSGIQKKPILGIKKLSRGGHRKSETISPFGRSNPSTPTILIPPVSRDLSLKEIEIRESTEGVREALLLQTFSSCEEN